MKKLRSLAELQLLVDSYIPNSPFSLIFSSKDHCVLIFDEPLELISLFQLHRLDYDDWNSHAECLAGILRNLKWCLPNL